MPPTSYQLDTIAASLIERLEGSRRTWVGQPEQAAQGFRRIAEETLDQITREYDAVMREHTWTTTLRREILETFLPRYTRLAIEHSALEAEGYRAWRRGDPVARVIATGLSLLGAIALERIFRHPITLLAFILALMVPIIPELRAWYYRRQYHQQLQSSVDDLARIQEELERYQDIEPTDGRLEDARARARQLQAERERP